MALTTEPVTSPRHGFRAVRAGSGVDVGQSVRSASIPTASVADQSFETAPPQAAEHTGAAVRGKRRGWGQRYASQLAITDVIALVWAAIGVHLVQPQVSRSAFTSDSLNPSFVALTAGLLVVWLIALHFSGRDPKTIGHGPTEYKQIVHATLVVFGLIAIAAYLFQLDLPRSYLLVMMPAGLTAVLASRFVWRRWLHHRRDLGLCPDTIDRTHQKGLLDVAEIWPEERPKASDTSHHAVCVGSLNIPHHSPQSALRFINVDSRRSVS